MLLDNFETDKTFDYESEFYATATEARYGKFIAHYEFYKK